MFTRIRALSLLLLLLPVGWPSPLPAMQLDPAPLVIESSSFLLVASKQMTDPRFRRSVLVVTSHGNTGPIGVIVNRPQDIKLGKIFPDYPAARDMDLFYGGPVYIRQVTYLVRGSKAVSGALTISSNIYLAYDLQTLDELLSGKRGYKDLRVMHGMASWAPGQLEYEVKIGSWYVLPLDEEIIFSHSPADMWQELYNRATSIVL
ncbi:MAG TPA: YqgE/AlgH family protein [Gallionella sp.]|nr:YqgE/AlgH family protein [Gallionella sp.]